MSLATLATRRQEILWWEFASLMHDIGKLSDDFLYYRQHWHAMPDGWEKDPHDNGWYLRGPKSANEPLGDVVLFNDFPSLAKFFEAKGVARAVNEHIRPTADPLVSLLAIGDRTDSRYDRNNPLPGCEQTDHEHVSGPGIDGPDMFRGNVFGYEGQDKKIIKGTPDPKTTDFLRPVFEKPGILNKARRALYTELDTKLSGFYANPETANLSASQYKELRDLLKKYFEPAMSDTTRPCNDTSLWEHVYSVASITKAQHAKQLIEPQFGPGWDDVRLFRIWGFGFDTLRYLSSAHKIGDVLGRRKVIEDIFDGAEELIQYTYPLGNRIYRDDNCVFFMAADLPGSLTELEGQIVAITKTCSNGEVVPHFVRTKEAGRNLVGIVTCIERLREDLATPVTAHAEALQSDSGQEGSVCPVCRLCAIPPDESEEKVCRRCLKRRGGSARHAMDQGQTPYLSEIADANSRAALIVAKFGLDDWLNGRLVRTTLITEPKGADHMLKVFKDFKETHYAAAGTSRAAWISGKPRYDYATMLAEFQKCRVAGNKEYSNSGFLYGRALRPQNEVLPVWEETGRELEEELGRPPSGEELFNAVCAKTPTPSTVLDAWETTLEFLKNVAAPITTYVTDDSAEVFREIPAFLETLQRKDLKKSQRAIITVTGDFRGLDENDIFDTASIAGKPAGAIYLGVNKGVHRFAICGTPYKTDWHGKTLKLNETKSFTVQTPDAGATTEENYFPYRLISASPDLLLLIVPASAAVAVTQALYQRYLQQFGKVYGRLPFSIGNIFFPQYLPMFSVLDAARRMERNFRLLHEKLRLLAEFARPALVKMKLGAEEASDDPDYYHPYVLTKEKHPEAEGYFDTIAGPVVSMHANPPPADALLHPNYYDCEWLGSSADRLRIHVKIDDAIKEAGRTQLRKLVARPRGGEGPILLDELCDRVIPLWEHLQRAPTVTDSHMRNFETLMEDRRKAWAAEVPVAAEAALNGLSASLLRHYLPQSMWEEAEQAHKDGLLTLTLRLYLHILKDKVKEDKLKETA